MLNHLGLHLVMWSTVSCLSESTHSLEEVRFCWCPQLLVRDEVRLVNQHLRHRCCSALPSLVQKTLNNFNFVKNGLRHLFLILSLTPDC